MNELVGQGRPLYSTLDLGAKAIKRRVGTGAEFLGELMRLPGVKPTELKERGLEHLMAAPKMTHEQFISELGNKPVMPLQEKTLTLPDKKALEKRAQELIEHDAWNNSGRFAAHGQERIDAYKHHIERLNKPVRKQIYLDNALKEIDDGYQARHENYTLPNGENYREILIKSPSTSQEVFQGNKNHYNGEPAIIASMRVSDRNTPEGKKLLHLEELQSDWHQQGREHGYAPSIEEREKSLAKLKDLMENHGDDPNHFAEIAKLRGDVDGRINGKEVPDAPFKKNWEEMALKRLVHHAATNGYHGIVVTPASAQADRYSLKKKIDSIHAFKEDGGHRIFARAKNGSNYDLGVHTPESMPDLVGKDLASKISQQSTPTNVYQAKDLELGGEGMNAFYDKKVPNILNGIGKKYGAKVDPNSFSIDQTDQNNQTKLHHFPITDSMRQDVSANGFPLYASGGIVSMKEGGSAEIIKQSLMDKLSNGETLSKAENEILGLYHRVGGNKKLKKPISEYNFDIEPNPKVKMASEKIISPEDLFGGYGIPFIGDSSMAGRIVTGSNGNKFHQPVELEGGHDYMRANQHDDPDKRAIWASALGKVNHLTNKAARISKNGDPVYGIHTTMSPIGVDFSHMPVEVLAEMIKQSKITKKAIKQFDKEMREDHPKFPGVMHEDTHQALIARNAANMRKHFMNRMSLNEYQNAGFPEIASARIAVQHKNLMDNDHMGKQYVGSSIGKFRPDFGKVADPVTPHHSYPSVIGGEYVGALNPESSKPLLNAEDFFTDHHKLRREFNKPKNSDARSLDLSPPVQKFDQEWLDKVMPIYLKNRKHILGYSKGGSTIEDMREELKLRNKTKKENK